MSNQILDDFRELNNSPEREGDLLKLKIIAILALIVGIALYFLISLLDYHHVNSYLEYGLRVLLIDSVLLLSYIELIDKIVFRFVASIKPNKEELPLGYTHVENLAFIVTVQGVALIPCFVILVIIWLISYFGYSISFNVWAYTFDFALMGLFVLTTIVIYIDRVMRVNNYYKKEKKAESPKSSAYDIGRLKIKALASAVLVIGVILFLSIIYYLPMDFYDMLSEVNDDGAKPYPLIALSVLSILIYNYGVFGWVFIRKFINTIPPLGQIIEKKGGKMAILGAYFKYFLMMILCQFFLVVILFVLMSIFQWIQTELKTEYYYLIFDITYLYVLINLVVIAYILYQEISSELIENKTNP